MWHCNIQYSLSLRNLRNVFFSLTKFQNFYMFYRIQKRDRNVNFLKKLYKQQAMLVALVA